MDNEIDRDHRKRNASGGSNLGWGRVSAATNIQITYRLLMLYLGIIQGSGVLWWYGVDSMSPASNCPVYHRQNCRKLTIIILYQGRLTSAPTRWRWPCPTATASSRAASRACTSTSACQSGNWASHRWHVISSHIVMLSNIVMLSLTCLSLLSSGQQMAIQCYYFGVSSIAPFLTIEPLESLKTINK